MHAIKILSNLHEWREDSLQENYIKSSQVTEIHIITEIDEHWLGCD